MQELTDEERFHELSFYTLAHPDHNYFIHQLAVDAYTAQQADENTKPVAITFALAGLYLVVEKGYTGREVQLAHMAMARRKGNWPVFDLPAHRGSITVTHVLFCKPGVERDTMIHAWCREVCQTYASQFAKLLPALP